jgi:hypothetical protein
MLGNIDIKIHEKVNTRSYCPFLGSKSSLMDVVMQTWKMACFLPKVVFERGLTLVTLLNGHFSSNDGTCY